MWKWFRSERDEKREGEVGPLGRSRVVMTAKGDDRSGLACDKMSLWVLRTKEVGVKCEVCEVCKVPKVPSVHHQDHMSHRSTRAVCTSLAKKSHFKHEWPLTLALNIRKVLPTNALSTGAVSKRRR